MGDHSLQATWIRNTILHALRQSTKASARSIPINFVYLNPTIQRLGKFVTQAAHQAERAVDPLDGTLGTISEMNALLNKYSQDFSSHQSLADWTGGEVVLLTGSTGGLGSYILEILLLNSSFSRVYVLNRKDKSGRTSHDRQRITFEDRAVDVALLQSQKLVFLEGDTSLDAFGLEGSVYEGLRKSVTCIMHSGVS